MRDIEFSKIMIRLRTEINAIKDEKDLLKKQNNELCKRVSDCEKYLSNIGIEIWQDDIDEALNILKGD